MVGQVSYPALEVGHPRYPWHQATVGCLMCNTFVTLNKLIWFTVFWIWLYGSRKYALIVFITYWRAHACSNFTRTLHFPQLRDIFWYPGCVPFTPTTPPVHHQANPTQLPLFGLPRNLKGAPQPTLNTTTSCAVQQEPLFWRFPCKDTGE